MQSQEKSKLEITKTTTDYTEFVQYNKSILAAGHSGTEEEIRCVFDDI